MKPHVIDPADVRMSNPPCELNFPFEPGRKVCPQGVLLSQCFQGKLSTEFGIGYLVHLTHASDPEQVSNDESPHPVARRKHMSCGPVEEKSAGDGTCKQAAGII